MTRSIGPSYSFLLPTRSWLLSYTNSTTWGILFFFNCNNLQWITIFNLLMNSAHFDPFIVNLMWCNILWDKLVPATTYIRPLWTVVSSSVFWNKSEKKLLWPWYWETTKHKNLCPEHSCGGKITVTKPWYCYCYKAWTLVTSINDKYIWHHTWLHVLFLLDNSLKPFLLG